MTVPRTDLALEAADDLAARAKNFAPPEGIRRLESLQEGYAIHPNTWKSLGEQLVVIHRTGYLKLRKNFYFKG